MKYKTFGKSGVEVSQVAFGGIPIQRRSKEDAELMVRGLIDLGINFLDTAYGYGDSEEKIGGAIKGYPREKLIIASKSPAKDKAGFKKHLEESLKRLGTDYIDFYQHHNIPNMQVYKRIMDSGGAYEGMVEAVKEGKVRFPAFSSHSVETAMEIIKSNQFFATQVPFNFVDTAAGDALIPLAKKLNVGFISMKPLGGGLLDNARICFRFLNQYDSIIPDPGIEYLEEMEEIISYLDDTSPLTAEERGEMDSVRKEMGDEWCHRCLYCAPCPQGINIPMVLSLKSFTKRLTPQQAVQKLDALVQKSVECVECEECIQRCPYDLEVPGLLKKQREKWEKFKRTKTWPE